MRDREFSPDFPESPVSEEHDSASELEDYDYFNESYQSIPLFINKIRGKKIKEADQLIACLETFQKTSVLSINEALSHIIQQSQELGIDSWPEFHAVMNEILPGMIKQITSDSKNSNSEFNIFARRLGHKLTQLKKQTQEEQIRYYQFLAYVHGTQAGLASLKKKEKDRKWRKENPAFAIALDTVYRHAKEAANKMLTHRDSLQYQELICKATSNVAILFETILDVKVDQTANLALDKMLDSARELHDMRKDRFVGGLLMMAGLILMVAGYFLAPHTGGMSVILADKLGGGLIQAGTALMAGGFLTVGYQTWFQKSYAKSLLETKEVFTPNAYQPD